MGKKLMENGKAKNPLLQSVAQHIGESASAAWPSRSLTASGRTTSNSQRPHLTVGQYPLGLPFLV